MLNLEQKAAEKGWQVSVPSHLLQGNGKQRGKLKQVQLFNLDQHAVAMTQ